MMLCKAIRFMILACVATGFARCAHAAASAKAVVYDDGRIVYYYDEVNHSSDEGWVQTITRMTSAKSPSITVTSIVIDSSFAGYKPTDLTAYFSGLANATSITGLNYLDTSNATLMESMFRNCKALTSVDLSGFDTSKVTNMMYMFLSCTSLQELDLSSFSSARLTNVTSMFHGCSSLTSIYTSVQFDLSGVSSKDSVFYTCTKILKGDKGTVWSSSKASGAYGKVDGGEECQGLFSRVYRTLTIDASEFAEKHIASVVVTAEGSSVDPVEVGGSSYSIAIGAPLVVTYTAESGYEFAGESTYSDTTYAALGITGDVSLSGDSIPTATGGLAKYTLTIDGSAFAEAHVASVAVTKSSDGSTVEPELDGTYTMSSGIGFVITYTAAAGYEFNGSFTYADTTFSESGIVQDETRSGEAIPVATVFPVLTLSFDKGAFEARHISSVAVKDVDGDPVAPSGETGDEIVFSITKFDNFTISYSAVPGYVFYSYISATNDARWVNVPFIADAALSTNDVPAAFAISAVQIKGVVTDGDPTTLTLYYDDVAHSGTVYARQQTSGYPAWANLGSVKRVVVDGSMRSYAPDGNGYGFQRLFYGLSSVTNIEGLSALGTSRSTSFNEMFQGCGSLTSLDLSSFRTAKVKVFTGMFRYCRSLNELDLSTFSCESVTAWNYMCHDCSSLTSIYARASFDLRNVSSDYAFYGCNKLVGGNGTKVIGDRYHAQYAHVDVPGDPGYFTLKPPRGLLLIFK